MRLPLNGTTMTLKRGGLLGNDRGTCTPFQPACKCKRHFSFFLRTTRMFLTYLDLINNHASEPIPCHQTRAPWMKGRLQQRGGDRMMQIGRQVAAVLKPPPKPPRTASSSPTKSSASIRSSSQSSSRRKFSSLQVSEEGIIPRQLSGLQTQNLPSAIERALLRIRQIDR